MKAHLTKNRIKPLLFIAIGLCWVLTFACKKDGANKNVIKNAPVTYSGPVDISQDSIITTDKMDLNFNEGSTTNGTFFRSSDGAVGVFSGNSSGSSLAINGYYQNQPTSTFSGTLLSSGGSLTLNLQGNEDGKAYTITGSLAQLDCSDIAGTYNLHETASFTISAEGNQDTETQTAQELINLNESNCSISYSVPGLNSIARTGKMSGNKLTLSGQFVIPKSNNVIIKENTFTAEVVLTDKYHFTFTGTGKATGSVQGIPFVITGTSKGRFDRCFKVAVAFLRGGPWGEWQDNDMFDVLKLQAADADPANVITKGFPATPAFQDPQITLVKNWYSQFNTNYNQPNLVVVGHSYGGNAVRNADLPNVYSRITIDPVDPGLISIFQFNQRKFPKSVPHPKGRFTNIMASTTDDIFPYDGKFLLGYPINNIDANNQWIETDPPTNHFSILKRVFDKGYVKNEVDIALSAWK